MTTQKIRPLEGYLSIPQLAESLGVSRQRAHQIVKTTEEFPGARTIGESTAIVVPEGEVLEYLMRHTIPREEKEAKKIAGGLDNGKDAPVE